MTDIKRAERDEQRALLDVVRTQILEWAADDEAQGNLRVLALDLRDALWLAGYRKPDPASRHLAEWRARRGPR